MCNFFTDCEFISHVDWCPFSAYIAVMNSIINRKFRYTYSNATVMLIAVSCIVYFVAELLYPALTYYFALIPSAIVYGHYYWQFVTYMFVHGGIWHLFSNMLGLFIFGSAAERAVGTREFLLFYLLTGILSGIASFLVYLFTGTNAILLGASGALYAVMLLFAVIYPRATIYLFGVLPIRAPLLVLLYFIIEMAGQMGSYGGSVAHMTHLFGLLFAYLYCLIRMRINPWRVWFS